MIKKVIELFVATYLFAILIFGCKDMGTTPDNKPGVEEDPALILKSLKVATVNVDNITANPMTVSIANDKNKLVSGDIEAFFDYGKQKNKRIKTIKIEGASSLKVGVPTLCTLSIDADKGKHKNWSAKINVTRMANEQNSPQDLQDMEIDKIILGHPNNNNSAGKTVRGEDLTADHSIPDFTVPAANFPIQVEHKSQFTVEKVEIKMNDGKKEEIASTAGKKTANKDYTLVENTKTKFEIFITREGYKPLKLTFNVTYQTSAKKSVDELLNMTIVASKSGTTTYVYGSVGKPLNDLKGGKTTLNVSTEQPEITLVVNKGTGKQASADIKVDGQKIDENFKAGSGNLTFKTPKLTQGEHSIKIKIEKEDYEAGEYDFKLYYKPMLTFKSVTIGGNSYTDINKVKAKTFVFEATDPDPITLSGEAEEEGVNVYFAEIKNKKPNKIQGSSISLAEETYVFVRMYMEKEGFTTTFVPFRLLRNKAKERIVVDRIEVGSTNVEAGGSVTITQAEAKTSLVLTFSKKYESMFFTINGKDKTPTFDVEGKVATFSDIELTENGSKKIELEVRAADCAVWKASITVIHKKS